MRKTNYHCHTARCMHADGTDEQYVLAAIENGYEEIGFSDHSPWKYNSNFISGMRMGLRDFDGYAKSIRALKEKYKDQISIKLGLECEYYPQYMDWLNSFIRENDLDYILFGNHYYQTDENRIYYGRACTTVEMLQQYAQDCIAGMQTGIYSYLAHPDLFMRAYPIFDEHCAAISRQICEEAKRLNLPLEYNLEGAMMNQMTGTMQYPHDEFWKIAAEVGCKAIIGVDAHEPLSLQSDTYRDLAVQRLNELNMEIVDTIEFKRWKHE